MTDRQYEFNGFTGHYDDETHTYIDSTGRQLVNVSSIPSRIGIAEAWDKVDPEVLRAAQEKGTAIHDEIQTFIETGDVGFRAETQAFMEFCQAYGLRKFSTEQIVCNDVVAGRYDLTAEDENGETWIIDIKTGSTTAVDAWRWQVSVYANLLGGMNHLCVLRLNNGDKYTAVPLAPISDETIEAFYASLRKGEPFTWKPEVFEVNEESAENIINLLTEKADLEKQLADVKEKLGLYEEIFKSTMTGAIKQTVVRNWTYSVSGGSKTKKFNEKLLKEAEPDTWNKYAEDSTTPLRYTWRAKK